MGSSILLDPTMNTMVIHTKKEEKEKKEFRVFFSSFLLADLITRRSIVHMYSNKELHFIIHHSRGFLSDPKISRKDES